MNSFSLDNEIENLLDTKPTFIGAVYEFPSLLTYLHYGNKNGEEIHEMTQMACQMAGGKATINSSSTMESDLCRNAGPSVFQFHVSMLKSDKIWRRYLVTNRVRL